MTVVVAEYLGVRTDRNLRIKPIQDIHSCPFMDGQCDKLKKGNKPVCSVRDQATGNLWIVCENRLCATKKRDSKRAIGFVDHQKKILHDVAKVIFDPQIPMSDVLVKREVPVPVTADSNYSADFVMWRENPKLIPPFNPDRPVILEMQGGGETTNTGDLTKHIKKWEEGDVDLNAPVPKVAPLVTNAWRRQQEQFLIKGNAATLTGGRIVFCIGSMIYDYLMPRLTSSTIFPDLKKANWSLALLSFIEDKSGSVESESAPNSIPLKIDLDKSLFTNYSFFLQAITNQGTACDEIFGGLYSNLV